MKKNQILPGARQVKYGHILRRRRPGIMMLLMVALSVLNVQTGFSQSPALTDGYLLKVKEEMGTFTYISSTVFNDSLSVGIGTNAPMEKLDVSGGNIRTSGSFISLEPQGTAPISVQSSTLVPNLNSDMIDGMHASSFSGALHTHSPLTNGAGIQPFTYDGNAAAAIGINFGGNGSSTQVAHSDHTHAGQISASGTATQVAFFNGPSTLTSSSSLFWDPSTSSLGIGLQVPAAALHIFTLGTASGIRLSEKFNKPLIGTTVNNWDIKNAEGILKFDFSESAGTSNIVQLSSSGSAAMLSMNGTLQTQKLRITQNTIENFLLSTTPDGTVVSLDPALLTGWTINGTHVNKTNGSASVGTTSTEAMFNVQCVNKPGVIINATVGGTVGTYAILAKTNLAQTKAFAIEYNGTEPLIMWANGYMQVDNKIRAREVEVMLNVWQDAVFKKDYALLSLEELETYIHQHQHLPNIPSEEEVLANGISLGEMNSLLLQKVEELTLYLLEMNKTNQDLQNQITRLSESSKP